MGKVGVNGYPGSMGSSYIIRIVKSYGLSYKWSCVVLPDFWFEVREF